MNQTVRLLCKKIFDAYNVGLVMSEAFFGEPNFVYVIPDPDKRHRALAWLFGTFVSQPGFKQGKVYSTENLAGQAVWISPGSRIGVLTALQAGFLSLPSQFGLGGLSRFLTLGKHVEALRKEMAPDKHWYLMALGVSPALQGQGVGSSLMHLLLAQADEEQTPCYLETFNGHNLAFYGKHGGEVTRASEVKNGPVFWGMVRQPRRLKGVT